VRAFEWRHHDEGCVSGDEPLDLKLPRQSALHSPALGDVAFELRVQRGGELRALLASLSLGGARLPQSLLERFEADTPAQRLALLLRFLAPLSTRTAST